MLSALYYLFLIALCTVFMVLSAVALVVCWPFDRARRTVHELSRILVRIFFFIPPFWRQRVIGREYVDKDKSYVIVLNHNTVIDIPTLYYLPLNFRWVSKREVFRVPFFGQFLVLHGDICIDRGRAAEAKEQMVQKGRVWLGRGASVAVFPEGTRSKDGEIHRFKTGAFALAKEAGVEILPVVFDGTASLIRKNLLFNWGNRITIRVLPPVPVERVVSTEIHELAQQVHDSMADALAEIKIEKLKLKN
ncbi:MAG: 1-acyl-sn-glycerol-3-phosphate acyltransferase [Alistipes sp.]|nr:1-acyl-sn-glycerol-3-phosphate acyltransferase [Alistipes sp.]MDE5907123.1 1-acyl-sn-glycerol-3-phosphate acyltransferase [Alistipes sp.]